MEKISVESYGFQTVLGFTDSIFIRHDVFANTTTESSKQEYIVQFLKDCQHQLNVKLSIRIDFSLQSSLIRRIAILLGLITL